MAKPSSALVQIAEENQEDVVAENRIVVVKKKRAAARRPPTSPLKTPEEESVIVRADSRYGRRDRGHNRYFDKTPRFSGKPPEIGAPQYLLPPPRSEYETVFGSSTREDWGKAMGTIPKININGCVWSRGWSSSSCFHDIFFYASPFSLLPSHPSPMSPFSLLLSFF